MVPRNWQPAISKFEFLLVVALIGTLATVLLDRLVELQIESERLEVNLTIRNMRTGLQLAIGERLMEGRDNTLGELLTVDPVTFLSRKPRGYVGDAAAAAGAGTWRFDAAERRLEYRPRQPEAFGGRMLLRWRLFASGNIGGRVQGLRLEADTGDAGS